MRTPPVFIVDGRQHALIVREAPKARVMRLTVDPRDGGVRLTLPRHASRRAAHIWVEEKRGWIEAQLARLPGPQPIVPGAIVPLEGAAVPIDWAPGRPRRVEMARQMLLAGGPIETLRPRILRWLRARALAVLTDETRGFAARAGVSVGRISVADQRTRWGSCSADGDIRYSWRLILAPPAVRQATVAHEVAHRLHMHHGPAFHAAVAELLGRSAVAERRWLSANGAALHWFGRPG